MKYFKVQGFIIKRRNFSEADRLVTIFTKKRGKIRALAKGVRKVSSRRASHLEIFNETRLHLYQGKTFNYINEVETKQLFSRLRRDLAKVGTAYQLCELVEKICPEDQVQENVYHLLSKAFNYLNRVNDAVKMRHLSRLSRKFTTHLLQDSGFIARDAAIDPEEYAQVILEQKLSAPKFFNETCKLCRLKKVDIWGLSCYK